MMEKQTAQDAQNLSDHDLLIRIDMGLRDLTEEIKGNGKDGLLKRVTKLEKFMWGILAVGCVVGWTVTVIVKLYAGQ